VKKLSTGIYEDASSIQAIVNCAAGRKTKRFPHGTALQPIKRWRNETKVKLETLARRRPKINTRGTLKADVKDYLTRITIASWKSRRSDLEAWITLYGSRQRHSLTLDDARDAVKAWQTDGFAAWTIRHRLHALRDLFHVLDGAETPTPVDGLRMPKPAATTPVFVTPQTIASVAAKIQDQQTKARFMVLATTGARPSELQRAQPGDVDLTHQLWSVRTAKGGLGRVLRLNTPDMRAAWRAYTAANAWGPYDTSRHAKRLRRAGWPAGVRPYALRGTWGMEISRRGADLADIQQLLGHADLKTTRRYYVPPQDSRLAAATKSLAGRLKWR
jgi:integrase